MARYPPHMSVFLRQRENPGIHPTQHSLCRFLPLLLFLMYILCIVCIISCFTCCCLCLVLFMVILFCSCILLRKKKMHLENDLEQVCVAHLRSSAGRLPRQHVFLHSAVASMNFIKHDTDTSCISPPGDAVQSLRGSSVASGEIREFFFWSPLSAVFLLSSLIHPATVGDDSVLSLLPSFGSFFVLRLFVLRFLVLNICVRMFSFSLFFFHAERFPFCTPCVRTSTSRGPVDVR